MSPRSARNIFLVGPMGVGKTTIGKMLARELGLDFYDSDQEIERRAGADIAWIFDVEGEDGFREREMNVIDEITNRAGVLLSTGGGSVLQPKTRRVLQARGTVVFLNTSVELQLKRTEKDKKRPLLQTADRAHVLERLREERAPLYQEVADLEVFVGEGSTRRIVNGIIDQLQEAGHLQE